MDKRITALVLVSVAATMLLISCITKSWFTENGQGASMSLGLWGTVETCYEGQCRSTTLTMDAAKRSRDKAFLLFGKGTLVAGLIAAGLLAACGFFAAQRNTNIGPKVARVALLVTTLTILFGMLYMLNKPEGMPPISWGAFAFMFGGMGGVIGAQMLTKFEVIAGTYAGGQSSDVPRL